MNAWEEGDASYADVMEYPVAPLFPNARRHARPRTRRPAGALDLRPGRHNTIKREHVDDLAGEFPRFDERRAGLAYRHGWFAGHSAPAPAICASTPSPTSIWATGKRQLYTFAQRRLARRAGVRAALADADEGDGWLVAVVYRGAEDRSDFVVFDAQDVAEGPIATAKRPAPRPVRLPRQLGTRLGDVSQWYSVISSRRSRR